jgi:hypothetical protein
VALALGETIELQNDADVVGQQQRLDPPAQTAQAQCGYRLAQLRRAGDVAVPRVERDADFKPLVNVALRAEDRCLWLVGPDGPDTDRRGCYPSVALPAGGIR